MRPSLAPRGALPEKGPPGGAPSSHHDDDEPAGDIFDDDFLPLPPAEDDDDEAPRPRDDEAFEPALPPGDAGADDSLADDLPVGRSIVDVDAPGSPEDDSLGLDGGADESLDDIPAIADEGEGFENEGGAGLPDEGGVGPDDDREGPGDAIGGLDVDSLPPLEPDDEAPPPVDIGKFAPLDGSGRQAAGGGHPDAFRLGARHALPFAAQALATTDDGALAIGGAGLALFGGPSPALQGVSYPFDESAPALALCQDPWHKGSVLLVDRKLDVYAFDMSRGLASPRPPLPSPPLVGAAAPLLFRLDGPRLVAWHPSGLTLSLERGAHWARFFHVPFVAFAADGALACAGLAESIEGRPRLHVSTDGGTTFGALDVPAGLFATHAGAPSPWLLGCHGELVVLGRPGRGLFASRGRGPFLRVPGGEGAFALAPPGGPTLALALAAAPGGRVVLVRADGEGPEAPLAELPEAFFGPDARLAWGPSGRLWVARGRALMSLEPPRAR